MIDAGGRAATKKRDAPMRELDAERSIAYRLPDGCAAAHGGVAGPRARRRMVLVDKPLGAQPGAARIDDLVAAQPFPRHPQEGGVVDEKDESASALESLFQRDERNPRLLQG